MNEVNQLVADLKQGKEEAFAKLYSLFESALINHLYKMLGSNEKAQEIFQETMVTMIKKINYYSLQTNLKNSFKSWLFRVATNLAIDEIRKYKKIKFEEIYSSTDVVQTQTEVETSDLKNKINELIMQLPVVQRTFLNLKVNEDLSHFEIAGICGCHVNAVKQGLFRARKTLKGLLIKEGIGI